MLIFTYTLAWVLIDYIVAYLEVVMRKVLTFAAVALALIALSGCAGENTAATEAVASGQHVAGFWSGWWHGAISPISFIISLFDNDVHFYEVHNNGNWYNFGFMTGAGLLAGTASRSFKFRVRR